MQERGNDCTHPPKEEDMDIYSTSTTKSSVHDNDSHDSDNDDDISESENSLREEAVLPETDRINSLPEIDRINLAYPREFGYAKIYEVEEGLNGNAGTKIAIPKVSLYLERGKALEDLNMIEYECLMRMEKKKTEKDDGTNAYCSTDDRNAANGLPQLNTKKAGRQSSLRFEYDTNLEIQRVFQQQLAAKQSVAFVIGKAPPKRPGEKPSQANGEPFPNFQKRLESWHKEGNIFAAYYLLLFRPIISKDFRESEFTLEVLQKWIADCNASKNWLDKSRLAMLNSRLNGMAISSTNKKLITGYRGRCRTIWTAEERYDNEQYFACKHAQEKEDLEKSGIAASEWNLAHSDLGNTINYNMEKQEDDISSIQSALEDLLPPSDSHNRIIRDAATNDVTPAINRVGQQVAKELRLDLAVTTMETLYSGTPIEPNTHVASVGNERLNSLTPTEVEPGTDRTESKTHKLEPDQAVVFNEVVRLMLQPNGSEETKPMLVLGPAGTGKTRLIFALLDAAGSKGKEFICTSFNAITATAIGGDTFSGDFFWRPEVHLRHPSPFSTDELRAFLGNHGFGVKFPARSFNNIVVGIILEEISTFSAEMVCLMDIRLRQVTEIDKPFGGLIVLMVGDFGQLGPVQACGIPNAAVNLYEYLSSSDKSMFLRNEIANEKRKQRNKEKNNSPGKPSGAKRSLQRITEDFRNKYNEGHPCRKGIDLLTSARLFHLTTQKRAQDPVHRAHVESMFRAEKLTFQMFNHYEELKAADIHEGGDFCDAPILCSTNRERHTINGIIAPVRASAKGVTAIRWRANLRPYWDQKPPDEYLLDVINSDPCFWEYFVPGTDGHLTDNLSKPLKLVNGTPIRYHSLSFDSPKKDADFQNLVANAEVGQVLSLPEDLQPQAINVELIDLSDESQEKWLQYDLSLLPNKIVIPLPCKRKFGGNMPNPIMVPGSSKGEYKCSKVRVTNFFPVQPSFAITIHKAQGRTIPKVIVAISERQGNGCGLDYHSIYVAFSRVKHKNDIRLLLFQDDGTRESLTYLTKLKADPCNVAFVEGFDTNGGKFDSNRVLNKYKDLTGKPQSYSIPSSNKRKRN